MIGTFFCSGALSQATTLTFEDLPGTGPVPSNYAGLTWTNWVRYSGFLPPWNPGSGAVRLFPQGNNATIQFGQDVTFAGAWLAGNSYNQYFEGYKNGIKLFESSHTANNGSTIAQQFTLNWAGVDEVRLRAGSPDQIALDNLQYYVASETWTATGSLGNARQTQRRRCCPTARYSSQEDGTAVFWRARSCTTRRAGPGRRPAASAPHALITQRHCCPTARSWSQAGITAALSRARNCTTRRAGPGAATGSLGAARYRSHGDVAAQR